MDKEEIKKKQQKIIFKFKLWGIFFSIILLMYFISNIFNTPNDDPINNNETTTTQALNYTKIKNELLNNNMSIVYKIDNYELTGNIENNILYGTLNINEINYQIKYDGISLYEIKENDEKLSDLLNDINKIYLLPKGIIDILNLPDNIARKEENKYLYNYDNINYEVITQNNRITNINIKSNDKTYNLNYSIIEK